MINLYFKIRLMIHPKLKIECPLLLSTPPKALPYLLELLSLLLHITHVFCPSLINQSPYLVQCVVVKDIPSNSVAVGNPCKVIRPITEEDKKTCWDK